MAPRSSIKTFRVSSPRATELYLTAEPAPGEASAQALQLYKDMAEVLARHGARVLQERVFLAPGAGRAVAAARDKAFGAFDDGVPPALLHVLDNANRPVAGAQVHAAVSDRPLEKVEVDGLPCGRVLRSGDYALMTVLGLSAGEAGAPTDQARMMLQKAERALAAIGGSMLSVARTWMWLADLLSWYDEFNSVRNDFFRERKLLNDVSGHKLPASTGIGAAPAGGEACAMDMIAAVGPEEFVQERLLVGGEQGSAFDYGSAFSRAVRAALPAGSAVYVSGTAAIDRQGRTEHVGDAAGQITDTISHVRAVLETMNCRDEDVIQAIAYCKTQAVESVFRERREPSWPWLVAPCDICRPELLFEVEATAFPGAKLL